MKTLIDTLRKQHEAADAEAKKLWQGFEQLKEKHGEEALAGNSDAFEETHAAHAVYGEKRDEVLRIQDQLFKAIEMDGGAPDGEGSGLKRVGDAIETKGNPTSRAGLFEKASSAFVDSAEYKALVESGSLTSESFRVDTPPVKALTRAELKTLVTGAGATQGDVVIQNDRQAGMVEAFARIPRVVAGLVTVGQTDSDTVEWVEMTTRTNNAAERAEATTLVDTAADAPESGIALTLKNTAVREIKHYIPATRTAMADAGQLRTIVEQELLEGLQDRLDLQMLVGNGTAPNLRGILNTAGIQTQAKGADASVVAIHKAITKVILAGHTPDAILLHPNDWQDIRLVQDANGNFQFGPPNIAGPTQTWGYAVQLSQNLTENTGLVGAFRRGATLWMRSGAAIAATDSHSDWFLRGIIALLATMRAAFGVGRPTAFCTVTGI